MDQLFQNLNTVVHDSSRTRPPMKPTGRGRDESWHARDAGDGWQPGKQSTRSRRNKQQVARKGWHGGRPKINKRPAPARQTGQRGPVSSSRNSTSPANARLCILRGTLHAASGTTPAAIGGGPPRPPPPPRRVVCVRLLGHPGIATATFGCAAFVPRAHIHTNYLVPHR